MRPLPLRVSGYRYEKYSKKGEEVELELDEGEERGILPLLLPRLHLIRWRNLGMASLSEENG